MAVPQVDERTVDALLCISCGHLVVRPGVQHWNKKSNKYWVSAVITIEHKQKKPISLRIIISVNDRDRRKRSFALMLNNNIRIRGLDLHGCHGNEHPDKNRWIHQMHKHRWTDKCQDRSAYTPTDITATDVAGQFAQFCAECGIECAGVKVAELPTPRLFDDL